MSTPDLPRLDARQDVFRVVRTIGLFLPPGARFPTGEAFRPTQADVEDARRRGLTGPQVSVWNADRVTLSQALEHQPRAREGCAAYLLNVGALEAVAVGGGRTGLRVHADPIDPPINQGSQGHCGILGLERHPGESRIAHRMLLDDVARLCRPWVG